MDDVTPEKGRQGEGVRVGQQRAAVAGLDVEAECDDGRDRTGEADKL